MSSSAIKPRPEDRAPRPSAIWIIIPDPVIALARTSSYLTVDEFTRKIWPLSARSSYALAIVFVKSLGRRNCRHEYRASVTEVSDLRKVGELSDPIVL